MAETPDSQKVRVLTTTEIKPILSSLETLLTRLPNTLPLGCTYYNFTEFTLDEEKISDYGEEGAFNHALEIAFCPGGRQKGPIVFKERGPGLIAIVGKLEAIIERFPESAVLQKWVFDLISAAQGHGSVSKTLSL